MEPGARKTVSYLNPAISLLKTWVFFRKRIFLPPHKGPECYSFYLQSFEVSLQSLSSAPRNVRVKSFSLSDEGKL